ncbi:undecaprenyl-diphosphate phosphatase [Tepidibacter aestuarii]|uniref:undecaprenyl-diphosphate phosphatase n=1 Tax=Tepidibacter aestuarii TaxID=2925782 RepID=UPI0020C0DACC|nr:undecaprenyl-diphosphate phosphatase [Tepidibacter aestuarii]CAH2213655.1 Undecaprenyl-diphosphatase 1 [Tepidibacter aestuarii]CAH2215661.1 Undecaprenyl-diphosphatase 1 [Tepidibacter aestuarii]
MSDILKAIILSIVEGVTEFLPISSTGHLILVNQWINFEGNFGFYFNVIIQFGAILSVVILYFKKLNPFDKSKTQIQKQQTINLWSKVIVGFIPAAILGFLFADIIENYLSNPIVVAIMLFIGGIFILVLENSSKRVKINNFDKLSYKTAFSIGMIQCLAMIPGTSRSAATIIGAMLLGTSRQVAAEFSFFLAIPTMAGATAYSVLKMVKSGVTITSNQWMVLLVGIIGSFIVATCVISFFMNYIKRKDFKIFGYYRIVLSVIILFHYFVK